MPDIDLDAELANLRDGIRRSMPVPDFDRVRERSRQRVVRRRMQIGAAVAVLVVSAVVPLLRASTAPEPVPPAAPPVPVPERPRPQEGPFLHAVSFTDPDHGYALRGTCPDREYRNCTDELLVTADGGGHWETREVPSDLEMFQGQLGELRVLGPDEIVLDWRRSGDPKNARTNRAHSVDAGRTWRTVEVPPVPTDTVPSIPDGGALVPACVTLFGGGQQCAEQGVAVVLPGSGASVRLANEPPLEDVQPGQVPTADGRWWMVGRDRESRDWTLAVSDDAGRRWTTTALDWQGQVYNWSVATNGDTLYASAVGGLPDGADHNGLLAIFRSTDGGRSWEQTWRPDADKAPRETWGHVVVADDGTLLINAAGGEGRTYLSSDGGRTFTEVERRYNGGAYWVGTGWVATAAEAHHDYQFSSNGVDWRELKLG